MYGVAKHIYYIQNVMNNVSFFYSDLYFIIFKMILRFDVAKSIVSINCVSFRKLFNAAGFEYTILIILLVLFFWLAMC